MMPVHADGDESLRYRMDYYPPRLVVSPGAESRATAIGFEVLNDPEALRRLNFVFFDDAARFEASADGLARLLRAAAALGVVRETAPDHFELTDVGAELHAYRDMAGFFADAPMYLVHSEMLDAVRSARSAGISETEAQSLKDLALSTLKPMIFVANVAEQDLAVLYNPESPDPNNIRPMIAHIEEAARAHDAQVAVVCAQLEAELAELDEEDAREYLGSLGVTGTGLSRFIAAAYRELDLLTFLTAGDPEVRAWTVREGARAPEAAGTIHSDIERGFIRAEVTPYDRLVEAGNPARAKELGYTRLEGKDYVMQEGDVVYFRFSV